MITSQPAWRSTELSCAGVALPPVSPAASPGMGDQTATLPIRHDPPRSKNEEELMQMMLHLSLTEKRAAGDGRLSREGDGSWSLRHSPGFWSSDLRVNIRVETDAGRPFLTVRGVGGAGKAFSDIRTLPRWVEKSAAHTAQNRIFDELLSLQELFDKR